MAEFIEWVKNWGLIDWTWPKFIIMLILCCTAGFLVAALQDKQGKRREQKAGDVPSFVELHAEAMQKAETGDSTAWADLGYSYLHGLGCEQDAEKALGCYLKGVELGDAKACYGIYEMYGNGVSLVSNEEAKAMLERAAKLGHGKATMLLEAKGAQ